MGLNNVIIPKKKNVQSNENETHADVNMNHPKLTIWMADEDVLFVIVLCSSSSLFSTV